MKRIISRRYLKPLPWIVAILICALLWNQCPDLDQSPTQSRHESSKPESFDSPPVENGSVAEAPVDALKADSREIQAKQQAAGNEISNFRNWADSYLAASEQQKVEMLENGEQLAVAHTRRIAEMIRLEPEQAIANAVPMVIRQDLPPSIVSLLEERVRMRTALIVNGNAPLPGQENSPDFKPYTRVVSTEDGENWNAYVYGKRGMQRTLSSTSINGISVGYDMAVADSPLRQLEKGERRCRTVASLLRVALCRKRKPS